MNAIEVRDVRKVYRRYGRARHFSTLKSALLSGRMPGVLRPEATFEALKGVTFDVPSGSSFGIIGRNGSGKSTMLKLIAGIGRPTSGTVRVEGRVSALIELGAGFHPEISGRENVFINGMMLGLTRREVARRFDEIVAFAGVEEFIDAPVKTYSSGMYVRLGFAVAINVAPDVLLVDEVLAVGDEAFAHKCLDKLAEFRRLGRTVLLVTHALDLVTQLCDEALWLDGGTIRARGAPRQVVDAYLSDVARGGASPGGGHALSDRWGSREVEIVRCEAVGPDDGAVRTIAPGDGLDIRLVVRATRPVSDFVCGVGIFNADGVCCYGTNTQIEGGVPVEVSGEGEVRFVMERLDLISGSYTVNVAVHRADGTPYDYRRRACGFEVASDSREMGVIRPPHRWVFSGGIKVTGL